MSSSGAFLFLAPAFMVGAATASLIGSVKAVLLLGWFWTILVCWLFLNGKSARIYFLIFPAVLAGAFYFYGYSVSYERLVSYFNNSFFQFIGNFLKTFKYKLEANVERALDSEQAAFLNGLILGERGRFSESFRGALRLSGTTHLVALSGYNIAIVIWALSSVFKRFFGEKSIFFLTVIGILSFVIMTGGEASVVRAAIMAGLVLLAEKIKRPYSGQNALAAAALVMTMANPKVIMFDWGFQLSFAAVIGLMYIRPKMKKLFKGEPGFLAWRENLINTSSAQLAVLPILIWHFGFISPLSLIANVLVLEAIPLTMLIGFLIAFTGFFSYWLSLIFGWGASVLLSYEIFIIEFFAKLSNWL